MDRRSFLLLTVGGAALTPRLLAAFQGVGARGGAGPMSAKELGIAVSRASDAGRPLLVIVIPKPQDRWLRQQALGAFLNHAGDDALSDLALCDVVCAALSELEAAFPTLRGGDRDPFFVLVETQGDRAVPTRLEVDLPSLPTFDEAGSWDALRAAERRAIELRNETISAALRGALSTDADSIRARAARVAAAIAEGDVEALRRGVARPAELPVELVSRGAAVLLDAAVERGGRAPAEVRAVLARSARSRFVEVPPGGAKWARSTGCGADIEGETEAFAIACGMAHVPQMAERFLYFLSEA